MLTALPLPTVLTPSNISASPQVDENTPSIAYDPADPTKMAMVYTSDNKVAAKYSIDSGTTWADLTLPAPKNGLATDACVEFDRSHNFFIAYSDRAADYSAGAVMLQSFAFTGVTPTAVNKDVSISRKPAYHVGLAVNNNLASFVDPETQKGILDANTNRIYVAWNTDAGVLAAASKDGGKTFTAGTVVSDAKEAGAPQLTISQGSVDGRVAPGQVNVVWDNFKTNQIKFDKITGDFSAASATGMAGPVTDAKAPANDGDPDQEQSTTFTSVVTITDPKFVLGNFSLDLDLTHPNIEQVKIVLTPPNGIAPINLLLNHVDNQGNAVDPAQGIADTGADLNVTFDPSEPNSLKGASGPFTGGYTAEDSQALKALVGLDRAKLSGLWKLTITDYRNEDKAPTQKLNSWSMSFSTKLTTGTDVTVGGQVVDGTGRAPYPVGGAVLPEAGIAPTPSIASDNTLGSFSPYQGRLYVAYTAHQQNRPADDTDVMLATSDDGGKTWSVLGRVNDDSATDGFSGGNRPQFSPAIAVDQSTGTLVATFYDARYDAARSRVARFVATSVDGGTSFGPQTFLNAPHSVIDAITLKPTVLGPIPDDQSSLNADRDQANGFGDRQDVVVLNGRIFPVWAGNQSAGLLDIYLAPAQIAGGPRIISGTMGQVSLPGDVLNPPSSDGTAQLSVFEIQFDRPVDPATVTRRAIHVIYRDTQTSGNEDGTFIDVASVTPLDEADIGPAKAKGATKFLVTLDTPQTRSGTYSYTFTPFASDRIRRPDATLTVDTKVTYDAAADQIDLPVASGAAEGTVSRITIAGVSDKKVIKDIKVTLSLTASDISAITLYLIAPDGTRTLLSRHNGAAGEGEYKQTIFDDHATQEITDGDSPFDGSFRPEWNLGALRGLSPNGEWQLVAYDSGANDTATLGAWSLEIVTQQATGLGNAMDQNHNGTPGQIPSSPSTNGIGDAFAMPGPVDGTGYHDFIVTPPFDPDTLPLMISGPHVVETRPVVPVRANSAAGSTPISGGAADKPGITSSEIVVSGVDPAATILDLNVRISLSLVEDSDLMIMLTAPGGKSITLSADHIGSGFVDTVFDDGALLSLLDGQAPFTGTFTPDMPLSQLKGAAIAGKWTLTILNMTPESSGTLSSWSLNADTTFSGPVLNTAVNMLDIVFDQNMDPATFTPASIIRMVTPTGTLDPASTTFTISPDPLGLDPDPAHPRTFRIGFPSQVISGSYSLTLASNIESADGEALDTNLNAGLDLLRDTSPTTTAITFAAPNGPKPIGSTTVANTITTSTIDITDKFVIQGLKLTLYITYANDPDLEAWLIAPDGTEIKLFTKVGQAGTRADFRYTVFDDASRVPIQSGGAPFFSTYSPEQPLSQLVGDNVQGTWTLKVACSGKRTGTLQSWSLTFDKSAPSSGLGELVADQATANFRIFTQDPTNPLSHNTWTAVGPTTYGGRVTALAVDPSDPSGNTVFVGGASGGVWKTTNFLTNDPAGPTYVPLTDFGPVGGMSIGGIAVFPRNNDPKQSIIFAATGEGDSGAKGVGFLRSMDGGATWVLLDSSTNVDASGNPLPMNSPQRDHIFNGTTAFKVVVDTQPTPTGGVTVYAALSGPTAGITNRGGIWRSLDSGLSWTNMSVQVPGGNNATDVVLEQNSRYIDAYGNEGNIQAIYAAFKGVGVYRSPNRGQVWNFMSGTVGVPHIRDGNDAAYPTAIPVTNLPSPNGPHGRIALASPERTGIPLQDLLYQGWLYAAVGTVPTQTDQTEHLLGLYLTKDYGQTWTQVRLPNDAAANAAESHPAAGSNDTSKADYDPTCGGLTPGGYANFALTLAIDPSNPNIVYLGGTSRTGGPGLIRVDTTGISDAHAFFRADDRAISDPNNPLNDPVTTKTPSEDAYGYLTSETPYMNLIADPYAPFLPGATILVADIAKFSNSGAGAHWMPFDTGVFGSNDTVNNNIYHFLHRMVTFKDPLTGKTRLIFGDEQGVYSDIDAGDGTILAQYGTFTFPTSDRNGNLNLAQFIAGAVQQSNLGADLAGALYYGTTQFQGIRATSNDVLQTGDTSDSFVFWGGGTGGIATGPQANSADVYYTQVPNDYYVPTDFFCINGIPRTFGLVQDTNYNNKTGDRQWPDDWASGFAVNPIDGNQIIISSKDGRIFGTEQAGQFWSVIRDPIPEDSSYVRALAYGAPDPQGPGGVDATNFLLYAGTDNGHIYVTFNGGGGTGNNWINISAGLDGKPVQAIVTNPLRGSHEAFAVTELGVYHMVNSADRAPRWVNITSTLLQTKDSVFGDLSVTVNKIKTLTSIVADWRYVIPDNLTAPNGLTHPMLYVGADSGVYRSMDLGKTWLPFPDGATDGALRTGGFLPSVRISDLDLAAGYIEPSSGRAIGSSGPNVLVASTYGRGAYSIRLAPVIIGNSIQLNPLDDVGASATDRITSITTPRFSGFSQQSAFQNNVRITLLDVTDPNNKIIIGGYDPSDDTTDVAANYTDANGRFEIAVRPGVFATDGKRKIAAIATDDAGLVGQAVDGGEITIDSHSPEVAIAPFRAVEKQAFGGVVASFTDFSPGCTATITWGNNRTTTGYIAANTNGGYDITGYNTYDAPGTYPFSVKVVDPAGNVTTMTGDIVAAEAAVTVTGGMNIKATEGLPFADQKLAAFTDPTGAEAIDSYSADINWGDGQTTPGTIVRESATLFSVWGGHLYDIPGTFDIIVTVNHLTANGASALSRAQVANPSPVATGGLAIDTIENTALADETVATFADPGGPEDVVAYSADINWGDGTTSAGTITFDPGQGVYSVIGGHTYAVAGTFSIKTTIHHAGAPDVTAQSTARITGVPVVATGDFVITATEGALSAAQMVATFTDPTGAQDPSAYAATITWGDGSTSAGTIAWDAEQNLFTVVAQHLYTAIGTIGFTVTIHHNQTNDVQVNGSSQVANPPVVASGGLTISVGLGVTTAPQVLVTFTDPGGVEPLTAYSATIDWGDGQTSAGLIAYDAAKGLFTVAGSHAYALRQTYPLTVTVHHADTPAATATSTANVIDSPPTVGTNPLTPTAGGFNGVVTTIVDNRPGASAGDFVATIDWGDGSPTSAGTVVAGNTPGQFNVIGSHSYENGPASFTITVTVTRAGAVPAVAQIPVSVQNAAPTASISGPAAAFFGQSAAFVVSATDPSSTDRSAGFTYWVDWGDGSVAEMMAATANNGAGVNVSHAFANAGSYLIKVTVADSHSAIHTAQLPFTVAAAPTLAASVINGGLKQRSRIDTVAFTLSAAAPIPAVSLANLKLMCNGTTPVLLGKAAFSYNAATSTGTLDLRKVALADGDYQLQISTVGGAVLPVEFSKLAGDIDGNSVVNATDQKLFKKSMGSSLGQRKYNPAADLNASGKVDAKDQAMFDKNMVKFTIAARKLVITSGKPVKAPSLDFGTVQLKSRAKVIDLTIVNGSGSQPLRIRNLAATGKGLFSAAIKGAVWTAPVSELTIGAGQSRTIRLYASAKKAGSLAGKLAFEYSTDTGGLGAAFAKASVGITGKATR